MVAAVSLSLSATTRSTRMTTRSSLPSIPPAPSHRSSTAIATQRRRPRTAGPLKGVVAMVDVRVGADAQINCSDVVSRKLRELGAATVKRLTPKLTHMVLSHFTPIWKTKITKWQAGDGSMAAAATRYHLKIVSQLWVNACYVSHKRIDERPFFPVSQHHLAENVVTKAKLKLRRRQSMGNQASKVETLPADTQETAEVEKHVIDVEKVSSNFSMDPKNTLNIKKRKRRALSMEPMTSDAILKMLGPKTTTMPEIQTPEQPSRAKGINSSAKRRKTLNGPPTQQDEDDVTVSQASGFVSESTSSENEEKEKQNDMTTVSSDCGGIVVVVDDDDKKKTTSKQPTAQEIQRQHRHSLVYGNGLTLQSGIWSCAFCGCSNPRARKLCTDCNAMKTTTKNFTLENKTLAVSGTVKNAEKQQRLNAPDTLSTPTRTPTRTLKATQPSAVCNFETPSSSPSLLPRSLTRPTASSAAKARQVSPSVTSRFKKSQTSAPLPNSHSKQRARTSLASASISTDVAALKLQPSVGEKRSRSTAGMNILVTPVVKKARQAGYKEGGTVEKPGTTPGSVSGFVRKHRDVISTPIPLAMSFSSTTNHTTPRKTLRHVIGITGVTSETRRALQCAIHAIDANMATGLDHRKARVVKSVDYAAGVTHLIVGKEAKRTLKVLFAIARGAWIVSEDWAFASLEQERWLPEEEFELARFANKYAREHPEARHVFKNMKIFVGSNVEPSREVLQSLVQVAGGEICNQISVADICICGDASLFRRAQRMGIRGVHSKWVFDCIASLKLEEDDKYTFREEGATPSKSCCVAASGLEAHSSVPE